MIVSVKKHSKMSFKLFQESTTKSTTISFNSQIGSTKSLQTIKTFKWKSRPKLKSKSGWFLYF